MTICPGFKYGVNLLTKIAEHKWVHGHENITRDAMDHMIKSYTWQRQDFMETFSNPGTAGDPLNSDFNVVLNDTFWQESIPHREYSGKCFTYDPPEPSLPGQWYSIFFRFRVIYVKI